MQPNKFASIILRKIKTRIALRAQRRINFIVYISVEVVKFYKLQFVFNVSSFVGYLNPIPAGVLENQDTLGRGQFGPPPSKSNV